jgi:hypothetical protein
MLNTELLLNWPPNFDQENLRRAKRSIMLRQDRRMQIAMMKHYASGSKGCIDFINDWCVTFDPRLDGPKKVPFLLFPRQRDFVELVVECIATHESMLVEKCRDVGASWICVAISVWLWVFMDGATVGWGSRKEEYVDEKGNPKAIFPKIRQLIDNLPYWMLPFGFSMREHAPYMKIINPMNGATITGEAGDNIGRGGRTTIFFKDESAHYERPELIEAALGDNTDVQVDISSVNGSANPFYRRRMAGEVWEPGKIIGKGITRIFVFDWRDHPAKTQEWYDRRRLKAEREGLSHVFAQEVDRDYAGSVVGVIIPALWVNAIVDAHIKLSHFGDWFAGEHVAAQDISDEGADKNANTGRWGSVIKYSEEWAGDPGAAATEAKPLCVDNQIYELYYDSIGVGAGFKVAVNGMIERAQWPESVRVMKWDASAAPLDPTDPVIQGDAESPTNEDQYLNVKAQSWFRMRQRVYKTYRAVVYGDIYPVEEMISLDGTMHNLHALKMQLSQAVKKTSQNGKTMVDKKPQGATSPNLADSCVMCCNPTRELSIFDVL